MSPIADEGSLSDQSYFAQAVLFCGLDSRLVIQNAQSSQQEFYLNPFLKGEGSNNEMQLVSCERQLQSVFVIFRCTWYVVSSLAWQGFNAALIISERPTSLFPSGGADPKRTAHLICLSLLYSGFEEEAVERLQ